MAEIIALSVAIGPVGTFFFLAYLVSESGWSPPELKDCKTTKNVYKTVRGDSKRFLGTLLGLTWTFFVCGTVFLTRLYSVNRIGIRDGYLLAFLSLFVWVWWIANTFLIGVYSIICLSLLIPSSIWAIVVELPMDAINGNLVTKEPELKEELKAVAIEETKPKTDKTKEREYIE